MRTRIKLNHIKTLDLYFEAVKKYLTHPDVRIHIVKRESNDKFTHLYPYCLMGISDQGVVYYDDIGLSFGFDLTSDCRLIVDNEDVLIGY